MKKINSPLVILLVLTSCTPPRIVTQLSPEAPEGHFEMGREYISLSNDSIDVELGFDGIDDENLVFDFVVINRTLDELPVNPSNFFYVLLDSAMADSSKLPPRMAVHPERIMHHYDENLKTREEAKDVNAILGVLEAGVGLLANTSAFIATEDPGYIVDAVFGTIVTADHYLAKDNQIKRDIQLTHSEKEIVNQEIFRMGEIPPGRVISGYVYFPKHPDTEYYMFCFPIQDQLFQFVYNQRKVYQYY